MFAKTSNQPTSDSFSTSVIVASIAKMTIMSDGCFVIDHASCSLATLSCQQGWPAGECHCSAALHAVAAAASL